MSGEALNFDDFEIQSFETTTERARAPRGTVIGQSELPIVDTGYNDPNCNPTYTQNSSCGGSVSCVGAEQCNTGATCGFGCGQPDTNVTYGSSSVCDWCETGQCGATADYGGACTGSTCGPTCQGPTSVYEQCATSAGWTACNKCNTV
jgi:hypothetical protein